MDGMQDVVKDTDAVETVEIKIPKAVLSEFEYIATGHGCTSENLITWVLLAASIEMSLSVSKI